MLWAKELSTQYQEQGAVSHRPCGVQVSAPLATSHIFIYHSTWETKRNHHGLASLDVLLLLLLLILLGDFFSFENFMHTYHDKNKRVEVPRPNCAFLPIPPPKCTGGQVVIRQTDSGVRGGCVFIFTIFPLILSEYASGLLSHFPFIELYVTSTVP